MQRTAKSALIRLIGSAATWALATGVMILLPTPTAQAASQVVCPAAITSCGCVITKSGTYTVANDLDASQTTQPVCIEISADHSILNLLGASVIGKGDGTGTGILIDSGAAYSLVEGSLEGAAPPPPPADDGTGSVVAANAQAVVTQWNIGIEDDADNAVITLFKQLGGNIFQQHFGNTTAGLLINGARGTVATNFNAAYNDTNGVMVVNSSKVRISNFSSSNNHGTGLYLQDSNDNAMGTGAAAGNGIYGIWLLGSSQNVITNSNGNSGNEDTGILLGCPEGQKCPGSKKSNDNRITNSGAPGNQMDGILIERNSTKNIVTVTHNDGNGSDAGHDMVDLNPHCDSNVWYNNTGSGNQPCVQPMPTPTP
jgi:parallel beta-helix repeat protein